MSEPKVSEKVPEWVMETVMQATAAYGSGQFTLTHIVTSAVLAAIARQREEDCKAVCKWCRDGLAVGRIITQAVLVTAMTFAGRSRQKPL